MDIGALKQAAQAAVDGEFPPLPAPMEIIWPELHRSALGCGVEDRGIRCRYEAAEYGWQDGADKAAECVPEDIFDSAMVREYAAAAVAKINPAAVLALIESHDELVTALREARTSVQANRDCLYEAHYQPHTGDVDAEGRVAVDAEDALLSRIDAAIAKATAAGAANTRYFNPESLKAAGQRFLLGPDGVGAAWVHPLELTNPRYEGWTDCTDMSDELFQCLIAERQHNTRLAAIALPGA